MTYLLLLNDLLNISSPPVKLIFVWTKSFSKCRKLKDYDLSLACSSGANPRVEVSPPSPVRCRKKKEEKPEEEEEIVGPKPMLPYSSMFILSSTNP